MKKLAKKSGENTLDIVIIDNVSSGCICWKGERLCFPLVAFLKPGLGD